MSDTVRNAIKFSLWFIGFAFACYVAPVQELPEDITDRTVGGWYALLPTVFAVLFAIYFKRLLTGLSLAVVMGAFLAYGANPLVAIPQGFLTFIRENLSSQFNLYILGFTTALFGLVQVVSRSGGMQGILIHLLRFARTQRSTSVATGAMGLAIFFDDYSNSMLVGTTMRNVTDRMRISREKLAYIIDSTAAPIAGISLISTWIAYEVGLFQQLTERLGLEETGYQMFLNCLPLRFYCLGALAFVFITALLQRDFGPMLRAERRALIEGKVMEDDAELLSGDELEHLHPPKDAPMRWYNAAVPILIVLNLAVALMLYGGREAVAEEGLRFNLLDFQVWQTALGGTDAAFALFWASITGGIVAILMAVSQRILTVQDALITYARGLWTTRLALGVLFLSWAIKSVCDTLHTDTFLMSLIVGRVSVVVLPIAVFLLAAGIAFATGTSWGTMGILLPVAIPLAYTAIGIEGADMVILWLTGSAVLDGAIYGDHCSPISDTTVLSSVASGCDHVHHVRTQFPYATAAMVTSAVIGYLGQAIGVPWIVSIVLIIGVLTSLLFILGERTDGGAVGANLVPEPNS